MPFNPGDKVVFVGEPDWTEPLVSMWAGWGFYKGSVHTLKRKVDITTWQVQNGMSVSEDHFRLFPLPPPVSEYDQIMTAYDVMEKING